MGKCFSTNSKQTNLDKYKAQAFRINTDEHEKSLKTIQTTSEVVKQIYKNVAPEIVKCEDKKEQVEVYISLINKNLKNWCSYSIRLGLLTKNEESEIILGTTNEKEPEFQTIDFDMTYIFDYYFEIKQTLYIYLLENGVKIGQTETTVGDIMGAKNSCKTLRMICSEKPVDLKVQGNPVKYNDYNLTMEISVTFGGLIGKPLFVVKRNCGMDYDKNWIKAYKSEVLLNYPNRNKFKPVSLSTQFFCNSDLENKPVLLEFYDSTPEKNIQLGQIKTTIENLIKMNVEQLGDVPFSMTAPVTFNKGIENLDKKEPHQHPKLKTAPIQSPINRARASKEEASPLNINKVISSKILSSNISPTEMKSPFYQQKNPNKKTY